MFEQWLKRPHTEDDLSNEEYDLDLLTSVFFDFFGWRFAVSFGWGFAVPVHESGTKRNKQ
jgi:hypothetical protein